MIPKQMAFFWVGRMSWMRWLTLKTFSDLNPGWRILLYTADSGTVLSKHWSTCEDDDNSYKGKDYWNCIPPQVEVCNFDPPCPMSAAQMCDLFQWKFLVEEGGYYADMDILWVKPFDTLFSKYDTCDAVFCLEKHMLAIGLVGSTPGCPIFRAIYNSAVPTKNSDYQHYGTNLIYRLLEPNIIGSKAPGNKALSLFAHLYPNLHIGELPTETVYKFIWDEAEKIFEQQHKIPNETIGIHWFGGGPIPNRWNRTLTESNWGQYHNTFTNSLRDLGLDESHVGLSTTAVAS